MGTKRLPGVPKRMFCKYCYGHRPVEMTGEFQMRCERCDHGLTPCMASTMDLRKWLRGDENAKTYSFTDGAE